MKEEKNISVTDQSINKQIIKSWEDDVVEISPREKKTNDGCDRETFR